MTKFLATQTGQKLAYSFTKGTGPTVVFLGGFKSDMEGSKAIFLEKWAKKRNRSFLRFDYSGHGQSTGDFLNLGIGDWFNDAKQIIELTKNNGLILIGSSMGGWISLLLSRELGSRLKGLITIAAAPDFTEDSMWKNFTEDQKKEVLDQVKEIAKEIEDDEEVPLNDPFAGNEGTSSMSGNIPEEEQENELSLYNYKLAGLISGKDYSYISIVNSGGEVLTLSLGQYLGKIQLVDLRLNEAIFKKEDGKFMIIDFNSQVRESDDY